MQRIRLHKKLNKQGGEHDSVLSNACFLVPTQERPYGRKAIRPLSLSLSLSLHGGLRNNWTGLCSATEINKARLNSASVRGVERQLIRRQTPLRVDDLRRRNLI